MPPDAGLTETKYPQIALKPISPTDRIVPVRGGIKGATKGVQMQTRSDLFTFRDERLARTDVTGFEVEATDGSIGKVDDATNDIGDSYIIVDTGPWIFGKKV